MDFWNVLAHAEGGFGAKRRIDAIFIHDVEILTLCRARSFSTWKAITQNAVLMQAITQK